MKSYFKNIKDVVELDDVKSDSGELVEKLVITAIMVTVAIVVMGLIGKALMGKGEDVGKKISESDTGFGM